MGCICSKGASEDGEKDKSLAKSASRTFTPSKDTGGTSESNGERSGRPEGVEKVAVVVLERTRSMAMHQRMSTDHNDWANYGLTNAKGFSGIVDVPNLVGGDCVAAGWPSWLTSVAGEAVKGWLPRRADSFEKLDKIGQGTYSQVYRARDLESNKIVALKKVRFINMDPESVRFMAREIDILRRLDHPNVLKLEGLVTSRMSCSLYLVFEYMEHDLAGLAARTGSKFTEPQVKCYMQQLLLGLQHCHSCGVLHRDIKGSNLLVDNNGILKIGDFGLATSINPDQKQTLTSRVVTLWYRPPELLLGATDYGVAVDMWSAGCILAELLAGKPIMPGRTEVEQLHKIFKLCGSPSEDYWDNRNLQDSTIFRPQRQYPRRVSETFKDFSPSALRLLESLLSIDPASRGTAASALQSEFFTSTPLACDPSSLPKYPPSKEYDAKILNEEAKRQRAAANTAHESGSRLDGSNEQQKREAQNNPKSISDKYNDHEESGSGFPIEPATTAGYGYSHTGTSMHPTYGSSWNKKDAGDRGTVPGRSATTQRVPNGPHLRTQKSYRPQAEGVDLFNLTGTVATKGNGNHREAVADRPSSTKKDGVVGVKGSSMGYTTNNKRIHYSGPLMPPGGNIEDMLKEHERQIQHAVRKARLDKNKTKKNF